MNGKVARRLRKEAYGDLSLRATTYGLIPHIKWFFIKDAKGEPQQKKLQSGQLVCRGPREKYQNLKKAYYRRGLQEALAELRAERILHV